MHGHELPLEQPMELEEGLCPSREAAHRRGPIDSHGLPLNVHELPLESHEPPPESHGLHQTTEHACSRRRSPPRRASVSYTHLTLPTTPYV